MKPKAFLYWLATLPVVLEQFFGGITDLVHGGTGLVTGEPVVNILTREGYPIYLLTILGVWKIPAAITLLAPRFPRLKEWAYAGVFFVYMGPRGPASCVATSRGPWCIRRLFSDSSQQSPGGCGRKAAGSVPFCPSRSERRKHRPARSRKNLSRLSAMRSISASAIWMPISKGICLQSSGAGFWVRVG